MPGARRFLVAALLGALAAQCLFAMRVTSVTYDEPVHLAGGYLYLTRGLFAFNHEAPPLMKYLAALPLLGFNLLPPEQVPNWNNGQPNEYQYGGSFLFENAADPDTMLFAARCPVLLVSMLLGVLVWLWARQLYGPTAGLVALGLYCFCPNIIAHSSLATLDLGLAAGVCAASYGMWRLCTRPTVANAIATGTALAATLLAKGSGPLVLGILPIGVAAALWRPRNETSDRCGPSPTRGRLVVCTLGALAVMALVVSCAYGPGRFGVREYVSTVNLVMFRREVLTHLAYQQFCWGRYSAGGFRWYFLAAFLVKTPVPTLLLTLGTVVWLARRRPRRWFDELFLLAPIAAFALATIPLRDNIGLRYILPIYPLLYVLIGGAVASGWEWAAREHPRRRRRQWMTRAAATIAVGWYLGGAWRIAPDDLAFFNELVGGPANGINYLDDSNVDWGQDLKRLARYVHERGIPRIRWFYVLQHVAAPAARYYHLPAEQMSVDEIAHPRAGWYAVSAHVLRRPTLTPEPVGQGPRFDWLERYTPAARIGYSIYLYRFD